MSLITHLRPSFPATPLLACPFCGSKGRWFRTGRDVGIECASLEECPGRAQTDVYEPEHAEHAAGQWNTRDSQAADHYAGLLASREALLKQLQRCSFLLNSSRLVLPDEDARRLAAEAVTAANAAIAAAKGEL